MLVKDNSLVIEEFKALFDKIEWFVIPRKLGVNYTDIFYAGKYSEGQRSVKITVRPSKIMQVIETFDGRTLNGEVPPQGYKGALCSWGDSTELKVSDSLYEKIKEASKPVEKKQTQTLTWD